MSNQPFITTSQGISGYFAVLVTWDAQDEMWEPWTTGFGRYETQEEAEIEAQGWAEAEEVEFKPKEEREA